MENKICFVVPYFGKFNNYFQVWLHSCKYNPQFNWLIFTDDKTAYNYPENVKVIYTTFAEIKKRIQANFEFKIVLSSPYQLCEFKVAYGEVFTEFLKDFDFWGHCDVDVIWGNLQQHITDNILRENSKISWRGHLTLYKNKKEINALYRKLIDGVEFYRYAFSNTTGFPVAPDERAINYIFEKEGERIYKNLIFADLEIRSYNFSLLHFPSTEAYKNSNQIFLWENGSLFRLYCYSNTIYKEDFAYIHFLKRSIKVPANFNFANRFLIVPNMFINYDKPITCELIPKFSKDKFYWSYWLERCKPEYYRMKVLYWYSKYLFKKRYHFLPLKKLPIKLPEPTKSVFTEG